MAKKTVQKGDVIFREGEESQEAYFIVSGNVQIYTVSGGARHVLADLGQDEVFGEMGMIEESPRSASAQAVEDTELEVIDETTFEQELVSHPDRLFRYLGAIYERLRRSNAALKAEIHKNRGASVKRPSPNAEAAVYGAETSAEDGDSGTRQPSVSVRLSSRSQDEETSKVSVKIEKFPFRIGRVSWQGGRTPALPNDLSIPDEKPFNISRGHCVIERRGARFFVSDLGSTLGTLVNGVGLGAGTGRLSIELEKEENELVLGAEDSPHRFSLVVERAESQTGEGQS